MKEEGKEGRKRKDEKQLGSWRRKTKEGKKKEVQLSIQLMLAAGDLLATTTTLCYGSKHLACID